ncbi:MAG: ABC transporter substrate-binding protein [Actinomycetota bacterium]
MPSPSRFPRLIAAVAAFGLLAGACAGERPTVEESGALREVTVEQETPTTARPAETEVRLIRLAVGAAWVGDPADAGPTSVANRVLAGLLHEGLTAVDANGEIVPALAERWFVSDDRLQWTFVLPEGLTDNIDVPLTARDVKASLERIAARGAADQSVASLRAIRGWDDFVAGDSGGASGIAAPDDATLVFTLDLPFEPLGAVLADPAFGITGVLDDGTVRTTGAYRYASDTMLEAVDPAATVAEVELVRVDGNGAALLASGRVDWAVLSPRDISEAVPGSIVRQPLELRTGIVVRLADEGQRRAVLGALNGAELALDLANATVAVSPGVSGPVSELPDSLVVHVPAGPLAGLASELEAQLSATGMRVDVQIVGASAFAAAVADGVAVVFPMVVAGNGFVRSTGVAASLPGGPDDVFGLDDEVRAELVASLWAERDAAQRSLLLATAEAQLRETAVWLPVADAEVRIGLGADMTPLRVLPDGTLDLSGF